ncbi:MAG: hypothetical protein A3K19_09140 [Lentisphaerae bacterium RIFOXYB12_FULL_65_16]|nr:MAG: hypothetical protein A3K18_14740 [Lentisphaerae bacterium RIFOXYA12_64_32]OGV90350.1 MAG: hypothetical protein A3K19_09140 [Lentisphaerae bacterium RIFOXYB12_FULL_65_16]
MYLLVMLVLYVFCFGFTFVFLSVMNPILPHLPWINPDTLVHEDPLGTAIACSWAVVGFALMLVVVTVLSPSTRVSVSDDGLVCKGGHIVKRPLSQITTVIFRETDGGFPTVSFVGNDGRSDELAVPRNYGFGELQTFFEGKQIPVEFKKSHPQPSDQ